MVSIGPDDFSSMGDLQAFLLQTNGRIGDYNPPPPSNPHPSAVTDECWRQAEIATEETLHRIQPSLVSEERRRAVVEYVHKLVRGNIGSEVFPFGSVPLKTYLPDGDIDLTTLGVPNSEDTLAGEVRSILEGEERNPDAEFEVKDVQYIHAEVKLVKCMVQNIVVDISFNQIGGLSTLCFLEQVDRHIGKNSLFKRSIILIKAWCYYESRILGAHHGLISTYALETLVLYIFHLFHSSLNGPLAVLYRFLDFFSKFDWDNYCVSLHGPISLSSLPELVAEAPENDGGDLLLSREFLRSCVDKYSDPQRGLENNSRTFSKKHMNVLDPLKENNNLGRSVNKGNFYRIRSAFTYGARKLGQILLLPAESIAHEINTYFMNTLDRHGSGERPDVRDVLPRCLSEGELREGMDGIKISSSDMENRTSSSITSNETYETSSTNSDVSANASPHGPNLRAYHDPHLYLGHEKNWYEKGVPTKGFVTDEETSSSPSVLDFYDAESSWCNNSGISASGSIDGFSSSTEGTPKLSNHLGDLTGDYGTHFQNLLYAQSCRDYFMSTHFIPIPRSFPSQYRNKYPSDAVRRRNTYPQMNPNGMIPRPPFSPPVFYPRRPPGVYNMDEIQKPRGTGTYFPNTNYRNRERQSPGRRSPVANQLQHPIPDGNNRVNPTLVEAPKSPHTSPKGFPYGNGSSHLTGRMIEFGTLDPVALGSSSQENCKKFGGKHQGYGSTDLASTSQKPTTSSTQERPRQAYKLKDNTDFPPLKG